ncbi:hypothetical protein M045_gp61 [Mycobacterium phage HINdeR]|uniref:Uncharacterized protein n=1 Tax=Mycobacterium phage HINdeR TaxID=1327770 RepID=R4JLJ8_9CAUD|nr:hypothetical protein M045_gp61 [Mycobacterium phage HINdeR]AGK87540.1 hypothetical protein PBI_HINDER_61 [Mycobacterium phage HINdeR]
MTTQMIFLFFIIGCFIGFVISA